MVFVEFRSKFTKFRGNSWISNHVEQAFSTRFPMSSIGGRGGGGYFLEEPNNLPATGETADKVLQQKNGRGYQCVTGV